MTIAEMQKQAYENAKAKGFHDSENNVGEMLMLVVSELGEALDAHRSGNMTEDRVKPFIPRYAEGKTSDEYHALFRDTVKDTFEDELADTVIRIGDLCGVMGIDLEAHVKAKMRYNTTRPYKHGKKY